jgi:hypothetical protein
VRLRKKIQISKITKKIKNNEDQDWHKK